MLRVKSPQVKPFHIYRLAGFAGTAGTENRGRALYARVVRTPCDVCPFMCGANFYMRVKAEKSPRSPRKSFYATEQQ